MKHASQHAPIDTALRFIDGLVVYPETCERAIHARSHWRHGPNGAVCACTPPEPTPPARDDWSYAWGKS